MSMQINKTPVYVVLNEGSSYPYTPAVPISDISVVNDHATVAVTVEVVAGGVTHTINCTQYNRSYEATFKDFTSINVTAGTTYQIELRGTL